MISVIVPVYNAEKTLCKCVDSVLSQTYEDFELILVDDGSKDSSPQICDDYAENCSKIKVFHKQNGGVSSARNLGIDNASGDHITFLDSDDWLENDFLKNIAQYGSYDLVVEGFQRIGNREEILLPEQFEEVKTGAQIAQKWNNLESEFLYWYPWGKLYKTEIIKNNNLYFKEYIYSEDFLFILQYLNCSKSYYSIRHAEVIHFAEPVINNKYLMDFRSLEKLSDVHEEYLEKLLGPANLKISTVRFHLYFRFLAKFIGFLQDTNDYHIVVKNLKEMNSTDKVWKKEMLFGLSKLRGRINYIIFQFCLKCPNIMVLFRMDRLLKLNRQ